MKIDAYYIYILYVQFYTNKYLDRGFCDGINVTNIKQMSFKFL
jgi:hypothetical protein